VSVQAASQQTPSTHLADPQTLPVAHMAPLTFKPDWQVPFASQYWVPPQAGLEVGSCAPAGTFTQLPRLPATAHDWQVPVQALMQQMPSTQNPDPQVAAVVQVCPLGDLFMPQVPEPVQYCVAPSQGVVALWSGSPPAIG
jgi:hypothetical protein